MRKIALIGLIIAFLCAAAGSDAASQAIGQVERLFLEGNYARAASEATKLIALTRPAPEKEELHYLKALAIMKEGRFRDARNCFEGILLGFPDGRRYFDAELGIGDTYYLDGDYGPAIQRYGEIVKKYRMKRNLSEVYYRLGESYMRSGLRDRADEFFGLAGKAAPSGFEARMATEALRVAPPEDSRAAPTGYFSVQLGAFKAKDNAEALAERLPLSYGERHVEKESFSGGSGSLYKVRAGRCPTRKEAEALAERLKIDGYETKICP